MPGDFNMTVTNDPLDVAVESLPTLPTLDVHVDNMPSVAASGPQPNELVFAGQLTLNSSAGSVDIEVPLPDNPDPAGRYHLAAYGEGEGLADQNYGYRVVNLSFLNQELLNGVLRWSSPGATTVWTQGASETRQEGVTIAAFESSYGYKQYYSYTLEGWLLQDGPSLIRATSSIPAGGEARIYIRIRRV